ncbi:MAG: diacylglycerol/lipid kinase family protein [Chloroflexota bacterium]
MKYLIIVNPTSGRGYAEKMVPQIESLMRQHNLEFDLVRTTGPWHAADLAEQAARAGKYDVLVTASGDGTANEAANGLMRARAAGFNHTAMSILPVGTGNDAAYGMGVPAELAEAVRALAANQRRRIDVGRVTGGEYPDGRYFINGVGIGFDAAVGFVAIEVRWARGLLAYLIAVLQTVFLYYKAPTVEMTYNGKSIIQPSLMISIMNGKRMGGGFYMAPQGNPTDGQFDLCIASEAGRLRIFGLVPYFLKGTQEGQPEIRMEHTRQITIKAVKGVLPAHCDGETLCREGQELTVELIPAALDFISAAE